MSRMMWESLIQEVMKDDNDLKDLFKIQNNEANKLDAEGNLEADGVDPSPSEKIKEDNQSTKEPSPSYDASQEEAHPPKNDNS